MQREQPRPWASQGATGARRRLAAEKNQRVALNTARTSESDRETTCRRSRLLFTAGPIKRIIEVVLRCRRHFPVSIVRRGAPGRMRSGVGGAGRLPAYYPGQGHGVAAMRASHRAGMQRRAATQCDGHTARTRRRGLSRGTRFQPIQRFEALWSRDE